MSEERDTEQAGAPVEQAEPTDTQVLAAVERAAEVPGSEAAPAGDTAADDESPVIVGSSAASHAPHERPVIAAPSEPPSAIKSESAEEIFAAHTPQRGVPVQPAAEPLSSDPSAAGAVSASLAEPAASSAAAGAALPPVRDGEIRISADHPMAALYMQSPMPPEMRGNRGAGVFIALLATVAFAVLYAGVLALWQAPSFPPSTFLNDGLLPWVLNWGFAGAALGFFLGLVLLVLIFGRAGWWAYVVGGLLVAAASWALSVLGFALDARFAGESVSLAPFPLIAEFGLVLPTIAAALVAREVTVWFGAWIGARGRKMKRLNAEAVAEYEQALTEVQAKQP